MKQVTKWRSVFLNRIFLWNKVKPCRNTYHSATWKSQKHSEFIRTVLSVVNWHLPIIWHLDRNTYVTKLYGTKYFLTKMKRFKRDLNWWLTMNSWRCKIWTFSPLLSLRFTTQTSRDEWVWKSRCKCMPLTQFLQWMKWKTFLHSQLTLTIIEFLKQASYRFSALSYAYFSLET